MRFNNYWKIPQNAKKYFSPKLEKELKEKYGMWYIFHTIVSIVILFIPLIIFFCVSPISAFEPTTQLGNLYGALGFVFGLIGSFSMGVGFVNIFMSLIKQYLGHYVTLISIIAGLLLGALGLLLFSMVI